MAGKFGANSGAHKVHSYWETDGSLVFYPDNASVQITMSTPLHVTGSVEMAGTASIAGALGVTGAVTLGSTLDVTGVTTFSASSIGFYGATATTQIAYVASTGAASTQAMAIVVGLVNLGLMASA